MLPAAVKVRRAGRDARADLIVGGAPIEVKWVGQGWLGDVRAFLTSRRPPDVVVARQMSPGAREALAKAGIGWVDETGAAEIATGSIVVSRSGRPETIARRAERWTPAVLGVAEALLCGVRGTSASAQEATGLSAGSCTNALRALTNLGLLVAEAARGRGSARRVADQQRLLDAYATAAVAMPTPVGLQVGVTWRDVLTGLADVGTLWEQEQIEWAATSGAAASVIAPYLTSVGTAEVYVEAKTTVGLEVVARGAGLRPIEGGRLTLRPFPTTATRRLSEKRDGLRVAPWPRVYADLRVSGVRGEEAAEHLREVIDDISTVAVS
ncbi:MAG: type IV toxin-antitoxin system AbiEi family antitoxin [Acidimicrobiia bacterium]